ncbi:Arm DNA-binding domain-containing protein [Paraburkholderia sacchari]|uniref:DUF4102 domain-containing protein n=1 Tax=Paraburkholderia sacchari TaxID=159450 RepID=A0A8T6ZB11_9BURK|nr:Arm DNA-binding domain-containing protein [Paraburkholderia sacchari]NLP62337.1 DUF4102 domain-containing protein [Paraburkholderia sacchari]
MAKTTALTDAKCKQTKHNPDGNNKLFDGGGLYLELMPSGSKKWRLKYRFNGKENRLTFGDYRPIYAVTDVKTFIANVQKAIPGAGKRPIKTTTGAMRGRQ